MKIHTVKGYIQTTYVIEYPDKILIFDSGCRPDFFKIKKFIETDLQRKMSHVKLVAVSHAHPDHLGAASLFLKRFNIPIAANQETLQWYAGLLGMVTYFIDVALTYYVSYRLKKTILTNLFFNPFPKINFYLVENSSLPFFPDWQVIKTPGHTPADICFYHNDSKTIYVADMIIKKRGDFILPYPIYQPVAFQQSLNKIKQLQPLQVLLAHYGPIQFKSSDFENLIARVPKKPRIHSRFLKK